MSKLSIPPCNNMGVSHPPVRVSHDMRGLIFDYLAFSFPVSPSATPHAVLRHLAERADSEGLFPGLRFGDIEARGLYGYTFSVDLIDVETGVRCGIAAAGGGSSTAYVSVTGVGMPHTDHLAVREFLLDVSGRITRIDIAYDDLDGVHSVHEVRRAYLDGEFRVRGRQPKSGLFGPWDDPDHWGSGLTYAVGMRQNGKQFRAYEKGKQLGDSESTWVRHEVELRRSNNCVVPLDVLMDPMSFFVGAYPWLAWASTRDVVPRVRAVKERQRITLKTMVFHARRSYGKLVSVLCQCRVPPRDLVLLLTRIGCPSRLDLRYLDFDVDYLLDRPVVLQ